MASVGRPPLSGWANWGRDDNRRYSFVASPSQQAVRHNTYGPSGPCNLAVFSVTILRIELSHTKGEADEGASRGCRLAAVGTAWLPTGQAIEFV